MLIINTLTRRYFVEAAIDRYDPKLQLAGKLIPDKPILTSKVKLVRKRQLAKG